MSSLKWKTLLSFVAAALSGWGCCFLVWYSFRETLSATQLWLYFGAVLVAVGAAAGYLVASHYQRMLDTLHLGILQLSSGNLASRVPLGAGGGSSFDRLFRNFNEMARSVEERIRLLQQLGEENVRLQTEANEAAVIEERRRLARDLHDTVSQQLFAIHMAASSLPRIVQQRPETARETIEQLIHMSSHAQKQMRGLIAQLRPIELEGRSLQNALERWFPDYCRQNRLQGVLDLQVEERLPEAIEHQMFLLIQEGIANVVKHSGAAHVTLSLHDRPHQYVLQIRDDGIGFDPRQGKAGSYGLTTMKERAQKLGGELELHSRKGMGTRIQIRIPKFERNQAGPGETKSERSAECDE